MPGRTIRSLRDVVDWRLCIGCGACLSLCDKGAVELADIEKEGIRPRFLNDACAACDRCLEFCPGAVLEGRPAGKDRAPAGDLLGPSLEILEGHADDEELRRAASSGGCLSALALYCLEREGMPFVLHTAMDPEKPWANRTVTSATREELLARAGSRYAPSSPLSGLSLIEKSDGPCVFIGKPCDAAALARIAGERPELGEKIGLVLSFFCAGTPSSGGTLALLDEEDIPPGEVREVRYRGAGWPGRFSVVDKRGRVRRSMTYMESWGKLQAHRPFRCHLCPDGLGERADIACGDAWHRFDGEEEGGLSIVMARSDRGKEILRRAREAGYLVLQRSSPDKVIAAQGILERRKELFGRLLAMNLLMVPAPRFENIPLFHLWTRLPAGRRFKTVAGTLRRLVTRGQWRRRRGAGKKTS